MKLVCTQLIPVGVNPEVGAMCLMEKIPKTFKWKQIIYVGSYAVSKGERLLQAQGLSPMIMTVINPDQGPLPKSFSYNEECQHRRRSRSLAYRGLGNDAMSRVLHQISKSPFTQRIERGKLPQQFTQPTFTMYNGRTDPVEHVSHFNQRMAVHLKNEALMCKVFPFSLGSVVMRWFDGLEE